MIDKFFKLLDRNIINSFSLNMNNGLYVFTIDENVYSQGDLEPANTFFDRVYDAEDSDILPINLENYINFLKNSNCAPSLEYIQQNCSGFIFNSLVEHKGENFTSSTRIYDTLALEDVKYLYYVEKTPNEKYKVRAVFK